MNFRERNNSLKNKGHVATQIFDLLLSAAEADRQYARTLINNLSLNDQELMIKAIQTIISLMAKSNQDRLNAALLN